MILDALEQRAGGDGEVVATLVVALCLAGSTIKPVGVPFHLDERDPVTAVLDSVEQLLPELPVDNRLPRRGLPAVAPPLIEPAIVHAADHVGPVRIDGHLTRLF